MWRGLAQNSLTSPLASHNPKKMLIFRRGSPGQPKNKRANHHGDKGSVSRDKASAVILTGSSLGDSPPTSFRYRLTTDDQSMADSSVYTTPDRGAPLVKTTARQTNLFMSALHNTGHDPPTDDESTLMEDAESSASSGQRAMGPVADHDPSSSKSFKHHETKRERSQFGDDQTMAYSISDTVVSKLRPPTRRSVRRFMDDDTIDYSVVDFNPVASSAAPTTTTVKMAPHNVPCRFGWNAGRPSNTSTVSDLLGISVSLMDDDDDRAIWEIDENVNEDRDSDSQKQVDVDGTANSRWRPFSARKKPLSRHGPPKATAATSRPQQLTRTDSRPPFARLRESIEMIQAGSLRPIPSPRPSIGDTIVVRSSPKPGTSLSWIACCNRLQSFCAVIRSSTSAQGDRGPSRNMPRASRESTRWAAGSPSGTRRSPRRPPPPYSPPPLYRLVEHEYFDPPIRPPPPAYRRDLSPSSISTISRQTLLTEQGLKEHDQEVQSHGSYNPSSASLPVHRHDIYKIHGKPLQPAPSRSTPRHSTGLFPAYLSDGFNPSSASLPVHRHDIYKIHGRPLQPAPSRSTPHHSTVLFPAYLSGGF
jgi:hypothetical protein